MFTNYQQTADHFDGTLQVVSVCPSTGKVRVANYSPYTNRCFTGQQFGGNYTFSIDDVEFSRTCGDGIKHATLEQCDGGATAGDCCSASCTFETSGTACEDGEGCTSGDTCNANGQCTAGSCNTGQACPDPECPTTCQPDPCGCR
jgi:cysteine-rich repeat protein